MRLHTKPTKPKRRIHKHHRSFGDFSTLKEVCEWARKEDIPLEALVVESVGCWECEGVSILEYTTAESEESYSARLAQYVSKVADYDQWCDKNKEAIAAELARRIKVAAQKKQRRIDTLQERLNKLKETL